MFAKGTSNRCQLIRGCSTGRAHRLRLPGCFRKWNRHFWIFQPNSVCVILCSWAGSGDCILIWNCSRFRRIRWSGRFHFAVVAQDKRSRNEFLKIILPLSGWPWEQWLSSCGWGEHGCRWLGTTRLYSASERKLTTTQELRLTQMEQPGVSSWYSWVKLMSSSGHSKAKDVSNLKPAKWQTHGVKGRVRKSFKMQRNQRIWPPLWKKKQKE